jgi:uncharacterized protein YqhQ
LGRYLFLFHVRTALLSLVPSELLALSFPCGSFTMDTTIDPPYVFMASLVVGAFLLYFMWDIAKGLLKIFLVLTVVYICSLTDVKLAEPVARVKETLLQGFRELLWPRLRAWGDEL